MLVWYGSDGIPNPDADSELRDAPEREFQWLDDFFGIVFALSFTITLVGCFLCFRSYSEDASVYPELKDEGGEETRGEQVRRAAMQADRAVAPEVIGQAALQADGAVAPEVSAPVTDATVLEDATAGP